MLVTNGVYASGGKVMAGDLTNRVALTKALTVQSVNGPGATVIQGAWDPLTTNGPLAVRCAWLTNGATLSGFTLRDGATRMGGDGFTLQSGGGVWCASTNATVAGCQITNNCAPSSGGGAYNGTFANCQLSGNSAFNGGGAYSGTFNYCTLTGNSARGSGGGAYSGTLNYCMIRSNQAVTGGGTAAATLNFCELTGNGATDSGGGAYGGTPAIAGFTAIRPPPRGRTLGTGSATARNCWIANNLAGNYAGGAYASGTLYLTNCTITGNTAGNSGGGSYSCTLANCIVYFNSAPDCVASASQVQYSCTPVLQSGAGNITAAPLFLADSMHLAIDSPCAAAGLASAASGSDLDGQSWSAPPSMGCDQWRPEPVITTQPGARAIGGASQIGVGAVVAGQEPFTCWWVKDGLPVEDGPHYSSAHTTCLGIMDFGSADVGAYQLVVSNAFGMATSQVAQVSAHYVDVAGTAPEVPYADWATAATDIQHAIDAAAAGDVVFVTNGLYGTGGKIDSRGPHQPGCLGQGHPRPKHQRTGGNHHPGRLGRLHKQRPGLCPVCVVDRLGNLERIHSPGWRYKVHRRFHFPAERWRGMGRVRHRVALQLRCCQ